jgi:hypothetical protein
MKFLKFLNDLKWLNPAPFIIAGLIAQTVLILGLGYSFAAGTLEHFLRFVILLQLVNTVVFATLALILPKLTIIVRTVIIAAIAICAVMNIFVTFTNNRMVYTLYIFSMMCVFIMFAVIYKREEIITGAVIGTLVLIPSAVLVTTFPETVFLVLVLPASWIALAMFYRALLKGRIYSNGKAREILELQKINRREALSYMNVKASEIPAEIDALLTKYEPVLVEAVSAKYVYKAFLLEKTALPLEGADIHQHLEDCDHALLFAATLGLPVDELIRKTEASDMASAVVLDALASAAIEQVCDKAEAEIRRKYGTVTSRYSPGYGDFPLVIQQDLLTALNAKKKIGLYANESNLLIPRKSVTAIIGIKAKPFVSFDERQRG